MVMRFTYSGRYLLALIVTLAISLFMIAVPHASADGPGYDNCSGHYGVPSSNSSTATKENILIAACQLGWTREDGTNAICNVNNFTNQLGDEDDQAVTSEQQAKACHKGYADNPNKIIAPAISHQPKNCKTLYPPSGLVDNAGDPINHTKNDALYKACIRGWTEENGTKNICTSDHFSEERLYNIDDKGDKTPILKGDKTLDGLGDDEEIPYVDPVSAEDQAKACQKGYDTTPPGMRRIPPKSACQVQGYIGWIICPTTVVLSKATDSSFHYIVSLMRYDNLNAEQAQQNRPIESTWSYMRNLANLMVIIALIMIVFSYFTEIGLSNYNIKRMLPRLIVMVVLINLSYWVCSIAIDVSNILGANIYTLLSDLLKTGPNQYSYPCGNTANPLDGSPETKNFTCVTAAVLSGHSIGFGTAFLIGSALLATIAFLFPVMFSALAAIVVVIFILMAREALITILIIVSPLAFAAYLLPNTSKWFDRWKGMFVTMILLYPLIALIFGGSAFASQLIQIADGSQPAVLFVILALGIQAIPLFIVPATLKSTGGMLGKLTSQASGRASGVFDKGKAKAEQMRDRRQMSRATSALSKASKNPPTGRLGKAALYARAGKKGREMIRGQKDKDAEMALKEAQRAAHLSGKDGVSDFNKQAQGDPGLASRLAAETAQKTHDQEASHINSLAELYGKKTAQDLAKMLDNPSEHSEEELAAALTRLIDIGEGEDYAKYIDQHMKGDKGESTLMTRAIGRAVDDKHILGAQQKIDIANGRATSYSSAVVSSAAQGHVSEVGMAQSTKSDLQYLHSVASTSVGAQGDVARGHLKQTARTLTASNNPNQAHIGENRGVISQFTRYS